MLFDIWNEKQRKKFLEIPQFAQWVLVSCILTWFITFAVLAAFIYVSDVGDAIAIYDAYPIFVPVFGLCFATGEDWKHRYFISLILIVVGIICVAQPGFIFGYSSDVNTTNQFIGCMLSLLSAILQAFATVAWIMTKKLTYLDLKKQHAQFETATLTTTTNDTDDATPLKQADALEMKEKENETHETQDTS